MPLKNKFNRIMWIYCLTEVGHSATTWKRLRVTKTTPSRCETCAVCASAPGKAGHSASPLDEQTLPASASSLSRGPGGKNRRHACSQQPCRAGRALIRSGAERTRWPSEVGPGADTGPGGRTGGKHMLILNREQPPHETGHFWDGWPGWKCNRHRGDLGSWWDSSAS